MNAVWLVLCKELLDAFRDRRMVFVAFVVMPLAVPLILASMSAIGMRKQVEKLEATLELPVIGAERAPNLMQWLGSHNLRIVAAPADAEEAVRRQDRDVIVLVDEHYAEDWRNGEPARVELIFDGSRPLQSGTTIARVQRVLEGYDRQVGTLRLIARGIHPSVVSPLQIGQRDLATAEARFDLAQQLLPYLLLLLGFIGGMQLAIDATAGERERQSLEPLLATPASREAIISGKILATTAFTLLSVLMTLLAYRSVFGLMPGDRVDLSLHLSLQALVLLFVILLPIALLGATVLTALAAFARSYREAQGYLPLLIFLPMLPTLFLMVSPVRTRPWMLAVPFLGQNQLILRVLRAEQVSALEWLIHLGAAAAVVAVVWMIAARLYHREQLAASS